MKRRTVISEGAIFAGGAAIALIAYGVLVVVMVLSANRPAPPREALFKVAGIVKEIKVGRARRGWISTLEFVIDTGRGNSWRGTTAIPDDKRNVSREPTPEVAQLLGLVGQQVTILSDAGSIVELKSGGELLIPMSCPAGMVRRLNGASCVPVKG